MRASAQLFSITLCLQDALTFQKFWAVPLKSLNVPNHPLNKRGPGCVSQTVRHLH